MNEWSGLGNDETGCPNHIQLTSCVEHREMDFIDVSFFPLLRLRSTLFRGP
jgi:hypothetical protein